MIKILIIEDNAGIREGLEDILQLSGYDSISSANGKCGIEKAQVENPSLILCDITMPGLNGYEVFKAIQLSPVTSKIPFVFLSANAQEKEIARGKNMGADAYLTKPFKSKDLLRAIEEVLK